LLPVLVVAISALGVRVFVDIPDVRTAMVQSVPALLLLSVLTGLAQLLELQSEGLGGLMPFGGLFLTIGGVTEGRWLPALTTLGATALLLWDSEQVLNHLSVRESTVGRTAARHVQGDYLPEAFVLLLIAMAGMGTWLPPELLLADPVARNTTSMGLFLLLPALAVSMFLRLDRASLLSWRAPSWKVWLLVPLLIPANLTLSERMLEVANLLLPSDTVKQLLQDALSGYTGTWGLLALTVVPGICEELLFRGAILGLLRRRFPDWAAILLQAFGFAILHGLAFRVPHTFALGLVFGVIVVRSGSIWPTILLHVLHNLVATQIEPAWMEWWLNQWYSWVILAGLGSIGWIRRPEVR
jgi:membrane protease YdiL (CAAX protease family)